MGAPFLLWAIGFAQVMLVNSPFDGERGRISICGLFLPPWSSDIFERNSV